MATTYDTYCGLSCASCDFKESCNCGGCIATNGKPFHGECEVAKCVISRSKGFCGECENMPCDLLKKYSFDKEHGDNGARIENCGKIKAALVAEAREGKDPVSYCGFHCDHCFMGQWCGGCRSDYNCCSFATLFEDGVCPNVSCAKEKNLSGCYECDELTDCKKGYYSKDNEYVAKAAAIFIKQHGKEAYTTALVATIANDKLEDCDSVEKALSFLEKYI